MAKIIFVGGLDDRPGDLTTPKQEEKLKSGFPADSVPEVISFRHKASTKEVLSAIDANPGAVIVLFSAGCKKSQEIAKHLEEIKSPLNLLHINEPYTVGGGKNTVNSAIALGVPAKNVYSGGYEATGSNIKGATRLKDRTSHFQSLVPLAKYLYENVEYFKNGSSGTSEQKEEEGTGGTSGTSGTNGTNGTSGTLENPEEETNTSDKGVYVKHVPFVEGLNESVETVTDENFNVSEKVTFSFQIEAKTDLPDFKIYVGDPEKWTELDPVDAGQTLDDTGQLDEYTEEPFIGQDADLNESITYESPEVERATNENAAMVNSLPRGDTYANFVPGKHKLDMVPGVYKNNAGEDITVCQIDKKPVNILIADAYLDMVEAAATAGISPRITLTSAFRPGRGKGISAKSEGGVRVSAQSQPEVWIDNCGAPYPKGKCHPETASPGGSRHGNGIALDLNTGSRTASKMGSLQKDLYVWLVKNSWKFGFVRAVKTEEWHFEYWPELAKGGPYAKIAKKAGGFHKDLGLQDLEGPNWA